MLKKLVSYRDLPYGRREEGIPDAFRISKEEFDSLKNELPYEHYDNYYMPRLYLQITGRCNLKCRHCFATVDNNPLMTEWSYEDVKSLLRQAHDVGVCGVTLTGGEPTVYPHLIDVLHLIKENELDLMDFNTNGFHLDDKVLDTFQELNLNPSIKISLDGIGHHDEFRGVKGSEAKALEAMRRCKARGFRVYSQTQVNRQTIDTIPALLDEVEDIGLESVRLIKTTETPRWEQNGKGDNFSFLEYYRETIKLIKYQMEKQHFTNLDIWEFAYVTFPRTRSSFFACVKDPNQVYCNSLCHAISTMISIGSDGKVYPCLEMQGYIDAMGLSYGNAKETPLRDIINEGKYRDVLKLTDSMRKEHNPECRECEYKNICRGGCVGLGMLYSGGDMLGIDRSCCDFFKTGIYDEMKELLYGKK